METDLSFQNILWFGKQAFSGGLSMDSVTFMTMPWKGVAAYSYAYSKDLGKDFYLEYVVPIPGQLLEIVNQQLSPFKEVFTLSDLDIMSVNSDGSLSSTTGRVEDGRAAQPPQKLGQSTDEVTYLLDEFGNYLDPESGEVVYYTDANGNIIHASTGEAVSAPPRSTPKPSDTSGGEDGSAGESGGIHRRRSVGRHLLAPPAGKPRAPLPAARLRSRGTVPPAPAERRRSPRSRPTCGTIVVVPAEPEEEQTALDPVTGEPLPYAG